MICAYSGVEIDREKAGWIRTPDGKVVLAQYYETYVAKLKENEKPPKPKAEAKKVEPKPAKPKVEAKKQEVKKPLEVKIVDTVTVQDEAAGDVVKDPTV